MRKHPDAQVTVSIDAQHTLCKDVCQRARTEACGLLLGQIDEQGNWLIERAYPLRNICDSPVYFEFAPEDLLAVEIDYPDQVVGVYHSHPTGLASASSTDRDNMQRVNQQQHIPWVWLIVSGPFNGTFVLHHGPGAGSRVVAYHHYDILGLRQITIQFEEG